MTAEPTRTASEPSSASAPPTGAAAPPPITLTWARRALAVTSAIGLDNAWGSRADRAMPCTRDSTNNVNASGNSQKVSANRTSRIAATTRIDEDPMRTVRSAPGLSKKRPSSGPMTAKGAIVSNRYSATLPRASLEGTWKNSELARAIATIVSPAVDAAWALANSRKAGPPAPNRSLTRCLTARPALAVARWRSRSRSASDGRITSLVGSSKPSGSPHSPPGTEPSPGSPGDPPDDSDEEDTSSSVTGPSAWAPGNPTGSDPPGPARADGTPHPAGRLPPR